MSTVSDITKDDVGFDIWFGILYAAVKRETGTMFSDENLVRDDYDSGKDAYALACEIIEDYGDAKL